MARKEPPGGNLFSVNGMDSGFGLGRRAEPNICLQLARARIQQESMLRFKRVPFIGPRTVRASFSGWKNSRATS